MLDGVLLLLTVYRGLVIHLMEIILCCAVQRMCIQHPTAHHICLVVVVVVWSDV